MYNHFWYVHTSKIMRAITIPSSDSSFFNLYLKIQKRLVSGTGDKIKRLLWPHDLVSYLHQRGPLSYSESFGGGVVRNPLCFHIDSFFRDSWKADIYSRSYGTQGLVRVPV